MGEAKSCAWILESKPSAWSPRVPAAKEIFRLKRDVAGQQIDREFLGTFTCAPSPVKEPSRPVFKYHPGIVSRETRANHDATLELGGDGADVEGVDVDQNYSEDSESDSDELGNTLDRATKRQKFS